MLHKYAWQFCLMIQFLDGIHLRLGIPPIQPSNPYEGALIAGFSPMAENPLQAVPTEPRRGALASALLANRDGLTARQRKEIPDLLDWISACCAQINITSLMKEIERVKSYVSGPNPEREQTKFHVENLTARVMDELEESRFLHVAKEKAEYYRQGDLFGSEVGKKFPKAAEDIANAGTCFALGQNTACVFHLMRVMEHCVQRFGLKLRVEIDVSRVSWHQIMLHVSRQIDALPSGAKSTKARNARKQKYSGAASRLDHVRLAWRNDVMHPKATYDEAEALDVLTSVKTFVNSIVKLV
jgi:hypothetical protein